MLGPLVAGIDQISGRIKRAGGGRVRLVVPGLLLQRWVVLPRKIPFNLYFFFFFIICFGVRSLWLRPSTICCY